MKTRKDTSLYYSLKKLPLVSIIIPIFNSISYMEKFLVSLFNTNYSNFEVIIIDDNSTDGTKEFLQKASKRYKKLIVIETISRRGLTRSRNIGIEIAHGKYAAFVEVDMLFDKNWLINMISVLEKDKTLGGVCGKVLDVKSKHIINAIGIKNIPNIGWVVSRGIGEKDKGQYENSVECSMGSVGGIARMDILRRIKGFDEELDRVDDTDYGWRIWLMGYRIITVPSSITYHIILKKWDVRKKNVTKIQQEMALGRPLRMLAKNYEMKNVFIYFPQALCILFVRALFNLVKGNTNSLRGLVVTVIWFINVLPSTIEERKFIQNNRVLSDEEIFKKIMVTSNIFEIYTKYARDVYKRVLEVPAVG